LFFLLQDNKIFIHPKGNVTYFANLRIIEALQVSGCSHMIRTTRKLSKMLVT
jgi:hypothetical protein